MTIILETKQLSKHYPNNRGIHDIGFQLHAGNVYGLLGPNGAGKTTFLKLITGLIHADRGTIHLFGTNIADNYSLAMQHVGCMIESADFHEFLTAAQYLYLVARFYPNVSAKKAEEMLDQVGLWDVRNEKIKGFSTGMKQKLALAAAMMPNPNLVILDEPTNGMDIQGTVMFRKLTKRFSQDQKTSFIISSHMIHELEQLCDRVGVIVDGNLKREGCVSDLLQSNQSLEQFYIDELELTKEAIEHV